MEAINDSEVLRRLRENVWHLYPDQTASYLQTTDGIFEVPTPEVLEFLKIRTHFSGAATVADIAGRSGVEKQRIIEIAKSLKEASLFQEPALGLEPEVVRARIQSIVGIWAKELKEQYVANKLLVEPYTKNVLIGWLLEMYHYIRDFPAAIQHAADKCTDLSIKSIIQEYASQERGHEEFVVQSLQNLGLSEEEIRNSHPFPSTQLIGFLMRKLFDASPTMVFAMALLVESQEFEESNIDQFKTMLSQKFQIPLETLAPYFLHQKIDNEMGHGQLLEKHLDLIDVSKQEVVDSALNILHDLKHAFELQSAEIVSYYDGDMQGRYMPRLPMAVTAL